MADSIPDGAAETGRDHASVAWWRALIRPTVLVEFLFGIGPLAAMVYWGWDIVLVLMLHLLALAVSAAFLILRTAILSDEAIAYFDPTAQFGSARTVRLVMIGLALFALIAPLVIISALLIQELDGPWRQSVRDFGGFWRFFVTSGLWAPLAFVTAWEAISFTADVLLPRLPFKRRFQAPTRPIHPGYSSLSRELQAYLFVRAWVVVRMLILVFGVPLGLVLARSVGPVAVVAMLVVLKTGVAVLIEIAEAVDADKREAQTLRRRRGFRWRQ
jgi:hypothetical protein